ncbi:imidazoleglycerol-phosphate dehydratase HisB [Convivina intestini]|uniref:imidazoleglycerol-phosphate dehydratase HisB n=1 Tax=Convivina intestini TaxID=1505726 RepID=UPI00200D5CEA|nr:imidazoleglycerol-phosphate dehydratase HisB [Convivina intestini]CAH1850635.1 Imidazoleglycerol-phosphate dehydratase [Convivina intestini]
MTKRQAQVTRNTFETQIELRLDIDQQGELDINTGIAYLDHMLTLFAKHGRFGLTIQAQGDLAVDAHHTTEDVGIVLGTAFRQALGDKSGIERYGAQYVPMDECLSRVVIDLSGRSYLVFQAELAAPKLGSLETEVIEDFWQGFADAIGANVHITNLYGRNTHHKIESIYKAAGRALRQAVTINDEIKGVNSTKGML